MTWRALDLLHHKELEMTNRITIIGFGPVGQSAAEQLLRSGHAVHVTQRTKPKNLKPGMTFQRCDVLDPASVESVIKGSAQAVLAVGFPYSGKAWRSKWPRAMANVLEACHRTQARLVFVDNLYMYGPQNAPLREDTPLTSYGMKPAVRAVLTRQWMAEAHAGRVRIAALRGPDFYGPNVTLSHLGEAGFAKIAQNKRAVLVAPPDMPHDFAYVPDYGRAVVTLLDAPDDCFGQAWHVPCAPIRTPREILELGAQSVGVSARISSLPLNLLPIAGMFSPFMRDLVEMRFQWDRPYHVDWRKFGARFWSDPTPFERGAAATINSFMTDQKV
jgi:nucleoside-diphosphate-sugar epimerase